MGRRKLKLEFIEKQKSRLLTLKNRKEGLKKKLHQLTTLCDVPACIIIRDPTTDSISIWPDDSAQFRGLIDSYKADPGAVKTYRVSDFFNERQGELAKLQKKNSETELGAWDDRLHLMDESQLRELGAAVRSREAMIKKEKESNGILDLGEFVDQDGIFEIGDGMSADDQLPVPEFYCPPPLNNNRMLYLGEFEEIVDQDGIFSIGDGMAGISADDQLPVPEFYCPPPLNNNRMLYLGEFEEIVDQDGIFSIGDGMAGISADYQLPVPEFYCPPPLNNNSNSNSVGLDLEKFEGIVDQDVGYSIADVMDFAMRANAPLNLPQDGNFSVADVMDAMSANGQLPLPEYYCPPPLEMFMDYLA